MDAIERDVSVSTCLELPKLPVGSPEALSSPSKDSRPIGFVLKQSRGSNAASEDKDNTQGSKCNNSPSCKRAILADYEKEATFHPKLNSRSLKIMAKSSRNNVSIGNRIFEANKGHQGKHEEGLSPAAKLNSHSFRTTQDRVSRLAEIQSKPLFGDTRTDQQVNCTFKPQVSEKSMRIAESLGTSFLDRQQMHMERKQRLVSPSCS